MEEEQQQEITRNNTSRIDEILALFDLYWFHNLILRSLPPPPPPPLPTPPLQALSEAHPELISLLPAPSPIHHRRTRSDESLSTFIPTVKTPQLQTIPSGKEFLHPNESGVTDLNNTAIRKKVPRMTRSMTELELEELKGLTELGFNFSDTEVEKDPRIADIVPGLRRRSESSGLRRRSEGEVKVKVKVARRPYLSEAWRVRDEEERKRVLRNWTVLTNGDESDVKEQLRRWAQVVASTVR